jgi:hypothetical protein
MGFFEQETERMEGLLVGEIITTQVPLGVFQKCLIALIVLMTLIIISYGFMAIPLEDPMKPVTIEQGYEYGWNRVKQGVFILGYITWDASHPKLQQSEKTVPIWNSRNVVEACKAEAHINQCAVWISARVIPGTKARTLESGFRNTIEVRILEGPAKGLVGFVGGNQFRVTESD